MSRDHSHGRDDYGCESPKCEAVFFRRTVTKGRTAPFAWKSDFGLFGGRPTVGRQPLELHIGVRIPAPEQMKKVAERWPFLFAWGWWMRPHGSHAAVRTADANFADAVITDAGPAAWRGIPAPRAVRLAARRTVVSEERMRRIEGHIVFQV